MTDLHISDSTSAPEAKATDTKLEMMTAPWRSESPLEVTTRKNLLAVQLLCHAAVVISKRLWRTNSANTLRSLADKLNDAMISSREGNRRDG
jgi:hypothetical protein